MYSYRITRRPRLDRLYLYSSRTASAQATSLDAGPGGGAAVYRLLYRMLLAGRPDLATHRSRSLSTALLHTNLASMTMTNDGEGKGPQLLRSTHHVALLCGDRGTAGLHACRPLAATPPLLGRVSPLLDCMHADARRHARAPSRLTSSWRRSSR